MAGNSNLQDSRKQKADEFYTPLSMIENELKHYREHFKGKTVLCNCDDPRVSNFFRYFVIYFEVLGIKKSHRDLLQKQQRRPVQPGDNRKSGLP